MTETTEVPQYQELLWPALVALRPRRIGVHDQDSMARQDRGRWLVERALQQAKSQQRYGTGDTAMCEYVRQRGTVWIGAAAQRPSSIRHRTVRAFRADHTSTSDDVPLASPRARGP